MKKESILHLLEVRNILEKEISKVLNNLQNDKNNYRKHFKKLDELRDAQKRINKIISKTKMQTLTDGEIDLIPFIDLNFNIYLHGTTELIGHIEYRGYHYDNVVGDIGYQIYYQYRGHNYAYKALCILAEMLKKEGLEDFWISSRLDNKPSTKTIEKYGGEGVLIMNQIMRYTCSTNRSLVKEKIL